MNTYNKTISQQPNLVSEFTSEFAGFKGQNFVHLHIPVSSDTPKLNYEPPSNKLDRLITELCTLLMMVRHTGEEKIVI